MVERTCDIAIIGAGTAGLHAYKAAAAAGADTLVIERGDGGSLCTATGCIPSKLLIAAARAAYRARRASTFGIEVGEVRIDGPAVMRRLRRLRDQANGRIVDEFQRVPPERRLKGEARFVGPDRIAVGDTVVSAQSVIVATGSVAQVPPPLRDLGDLGDLLHTNETIFELADLPASLAVVGAGPLGLELAQAFARLGVAVTVLDQADGIGAITDDEAEACARQALARELTFHLGVEVAAQRRGDQAHLRWDGGAVTVDLVLAATGRVPATDALDLAAAGLAGDHAPSVDPDTRRHADGPLFVAGDADPWRPVLHEAARGGRIAASVAAGGEPWRPIPNLAIAFTEPNIAQVGIDHDDLPDGAVIGTARAADNIRAEIDAEDEGLVRLYVGRDGALLGGTIVWTGGEHLAQTLALAIERGMDAATFADGAWYHPVIEEALQSAARDALDRLAAG